MSTCPFCNEPVSVERSRYRVTLEIEDRTRSTQQITGDETPIERYCVDRQVCLDCWTDLYDDLS